MHKQTSWFTGCSTPTYINNFIRERCACLATTMLLLIHTYNNEKTAGFSGEEYCAQHRHKRQVVTRHQNTSSSGACHPLLCCYPIHAKGTHAYTHTKHAQHTQKTQCFPKVHKPFLFVHIFTMVCSILSMDGIFHLTCEVTIPVVKCFLLQFTP